MKGSEGRSSSRCTCMAVNQKLEVHETMMPLAICHVTPREFCCCSSPPLVVVVPRSERRVNLFKYGDMMRGSVSVFSSA